MRDRIILLIITILLTAYFFYINETKSKDYTIPSEYRGSEGLDYIRENYASELTQLKNLCVNQFQGNWIDSTNNMGCYNMKGFSSEYCSMDIIKNLENLCKSIEGTPVCSLTQASCTL